MRGAAFAVALLAACASAPDSSPVTLHIEQLTPAAEFRFAGPVTVQFRITASNPTSERVTLSRIELRTVGPGAYVLREPSIPLKMTVPPSSSAAVTIAARGEALGGHSTSVEPVTVRATAYFDGPRGPFTQLLNRTFDQLGRR